MIQTTIHVVVICLLLALAAYRLMIIVKRIRRHRHQMKVVRYVMDRSRNMFSDKRMDD